MKLFNDLFDINIFIDETYTINSADNKKYDLVLNPHNYKRRDWTKVFCINIQTASSEHTIALIGSPYSCVHDCAILNETSIILLMNNQLIQLNLEYFSIDYKSFPDFGTYFSIYRFDDGYVIYGELEIIKLSKNFEIEWSFSGKGDVFVLPNDETAFLIEGDKIILKEWDGKKYIINKHGKEIS